MFLFSSEAFADLPIFLFSAIFLLALVGIGEVLNTKMQIPAEETRRMIHLMTGLFVGLTPYLFNRPDWIYLLAGTFVVANFIAIQKQWFKGMHGIKRHSWGTVLFPVALLLALALCWTADPERRLALQAAFWVLAFSDPLASWVGTNLAQPRLYHVSGHEKSVQGSLAFMGSAFILVLVTLWLNGLDQSWGWQTLILAAFCAAMAATLAEALGTDGWDNLFVVVVVMTVIVFFQQHSGRDWAVFTALWLGLGFAYLSYKLKFLNLSGALAVALLGASVFGLGGWKWSLPGLTFFILSSFLSKWGKARKARIEQKNEKSSQRDAGQVYANGGVAWAMLVLYVFFREEALYWAYLGAFAAAAADTWATEIGGYVQGRTWLFPTFKRIEAGASGGVSIAGTLGGFLGAASIWISGVGFLENMSMDVSLLAVVGGGVLGMFADSMLGTTLQGKYRTLAGELVERPLMPDGQENVRVSGYRWLNNDRVNLFNTFIGAGLAVVLVWLWA